MLLRYSVTQFLLCFIKVKEPKSRQPRQNYPTKGEHYLNKATKTNGKKHINLQKVRRVKESNAGEMTRTKRKHEGGQAMKNGYKTEINKVTRISK